MKVNIPFPAVSGGPRPSTPLVLYRHKKTLNWGERNRGGEMGRAIWEHPDLDKIMDKARPKAEGEH